MTGASSRFLFLVTNPISLLHRRYSTFFRLARLHPLTTLTAAHNHHLRHSLHNSPIPINFSQNYCSRATDYSLQDNNQVRANERHVSPSHPWPEWSRLLESLYNAGYFNRNCNVEDDFMVNENLSMEFVDAANSCLAFARDRPDILRWLPRRDIKMLIDDGYPFLFKSAGEIEIRMMSFLQVEGSNEATLVDLMKYILSFVSNFIVKPERSVREATESCVRRLLQEMALSCRGRVSEQYEQMPRNIGPNITMKRGDWICAKCNFMNFARNAKCLECEELRPETQLINGEWYCPRCNYFNYRKNVVCLKCECRRPDEAQLSGQTYLPSGQIHNSDKEDEIERWFKKIKELHGLTGQASDNSHDSTVKPVNEISYASNATINKNLVQGTENQQIRSTNNLDSRSYVGNKTKFNGETNTDSSGNRFTRNEPKPEGSRTLFKGEMNPSSSSNQFTRNEPKPEGNRTLYHGGISTNLSGNPFRRNEPKPEVNRALYSGDMNTDSSSNEFRRNEPRSEVAQQPPESMNVKSGWTGKSLEGSAVTEPDPLDMSEEAKAERWFRRVAQIKDISELSQIPDEDFPSIMPMRKGVNRFVVSKRKTPLERRLTSSQYRKNLRITSSDPMKKDGNDDN